MTKRHEIITGLLLLFAIIAACIDVEYLLIFCGGILLSIVISLLSLPDIFYLCREIEAFIVMPTIICFIFIFVGIILIIVGGISPMKVLETIVPMVAGCAFVGNMAVAWENYLA